MTTPVIVCPIHATTPLVCPRCFAGTGGTVSSTKKAAAARLNGRKGGRPPKLPAPR